MKNQEISDEFLNSFVDNQLDSSEKTLAFDAISQNESLKDRVCELHGLKEIIRHAYSEPPTQARSAIRQLRPWKKQLQALAACLLLILGGVSGWITHSWTTNNNNRELAAIVQSPTTDLALTDTRKIIVHISNANPMKLKAALDETEGLLNDYKRAKQPVQIELVANNKGVDLLRSNVSNYKERLNLMHVKYPNINFLVCGKTLAKLKKNGENVQLLPFTGVATSAVDQINMRLHEGWGYVRI